MNSKNYQIVVKTFFGLEKVLEKELKQLGVENIKRQNRAVSFEGNDRMLYMANFHLRTALRVLKPIFAFNAKNEVELYDGIFHFDWGEYFDTGDTLAIDTVVLSNYFKHSKFVAYKVKDAIVDQIRKNTGRRPSVNIAKPTYRINVHIANDNCTVSLDSSGESLHKRGYRRHSGLAPLNEILAAGMIMLTGWEGKTNFMDPMCGSGTLPIEAALIANKVPPGIFRKYYGFESWHDFNEDLFEEVINEDLEEGDAQCRIMGSDVSADTVKIALQNIKNASLAKKVELKILPFDKVIPPDDGGIIITNPPYGQRIKNDDIKSFYKKMGDHLKKHFNNYEVWILSSHKEALMNIGLHTTRKLTLYNGPLECKFHQYKIYKGSIKKRKRNNQT